MSDISRATTPEGDNVVLPDALATLSARIDNGPETLALGNKEIQIAALQAAKYVFDLALQSESKSRAVIAELLGSMVPTMAPQTRSQVANAKAKAAEHAPEKAPELEETPLPELVVEDMDKEQIWAQLELRAQNVSRVLEFALESTGELPESDDERGEGAATKKEVSLEDDDDDSDEMDFVGAGDENENEETSEDDSDEERGEDEEDAELGDEEEHDGEELVEEVTSLHDSDNDDEEEQAMDLDAAGPSRQPRGRRTKGHPELDDGFFNLATFNAETEAAEARASSRGGLGEDDDSDAEDLGDEVDMFTVVDDGEEGEPKELFYNDFFAPPSHRTLKAHGLKPPASKSLSKKKTSGVRFDDEVRVKSIKPKGKNLPIATMFEVVREEDDGEEFGEKMSDSESSEDGIQGGGPPESDEDQSPSEKFGDDEDIMDDDASDEGFETHDTIERLKDDLFADDDEEPEDIDMSAHEKRMAALQEEIAQLEAENVADKHWTLMGEATSRSRPQNALLEEDLEFERVMKSVPVITEDVVQSLEEVIKARIIEGRFDDVVRKRPADDKPFLPSRFFELSDTKSKQSLAEIYEDDYVAAKTGGVAGEDRDGKLKKEHDELEKIWESLCSKMDALSNAHFTPKAPKATISTMSNIASASLESALPTTKATSTMLAPQEVFAPSAEDLKAKSEMTPAEKRTLRNKQKKANRKTRDTLAKSVDSFAKMKGQSVKKQKDAALKSVVKSGKGVTVIGKKSKDIVRDGGRKAIAK